MTPQKCQKKAKVLLSHLNNKLQIRIFSDTHYRDAVVEADEEKFPIHKWLFGTCSEFFRTAFTVEVTIS